MASVRIRTVALAARWGTMTERSVAGKHGWGPPCPPVRVLHVFGVMDRGGAELRTLDIIREFPPEGWVFDFLSLSGEKGSLELELSRNGMRVHHLHISRWSDTVALYRFLRREKYDVVHSHVHLFSGFVLAIALLAGVRVRISHLRSTSDGRGTGSQRRIYRWSMRALLRLSATDIIGVSPVVMGNVLGSGGAPFGPRTFVIPNAVNVDRIAGPSRKVRNDYLVVRKAHRMAPSARILLHVGSQRPAKNQVRLVHMFAKLVDLVPEVYLIMLGRLDASINEEIVNAVYACGIEARRVLIVGEVTCVDRYLRAANCVALPSLWEGMPGCVLEAMAAEVPVVLSDIPELRTLEVFPYPLRYVALTSPDAEWAHAIATMMLESSCHEGPPHSGAKLLVEAGFDTGSVVAGYQELWSRSRDRSAIPRCWEYRR